MALRWDDSAPLRWDDRRPAPLEGLTVDEARRIRELRVRFANPGPADRAGSESLTTLMNRCRCLVCPCEGQRTIENPLVCRQCSAGAHEPLGGVL